MDNSAKFEKRDFVSGLFLSGRVVHLWQRAALYPRSHCRDQGGQGLDSRCQSHQKPGFLGKPGFFRNPAALPFFARKANDAAILGRQEDLAFDRDHSVKDR